MSSRATKGRPARQSAYFKQGCARTKSGVEFDPAAVLWRYQDGVKNVSLNFDGLLGFSDELVRSAKAALKWYAENRSAAHLINLFSRLRHFAQTTANDGKALGIITGHHLINYRAKLDGRTEWYLGTLSGFLRKWHSLGYPGIGSDAILLLKQLRVKGNSKGVAVLTMDPEEGPFTVIETQGLQAALNAAYATGAVDTSNYVLTWLYMLLAQRSQQYASLKLCDVIVEVDAEGNRSFFLMMPSAKNPGLASRARLVKRPIIEQFGVVLFEYAQKVRCSYVGLTSDLEQFPLFPSYTGRSGSKGYELHATASSIGLRLKNTLSRLNVLSERTGDYMKVNPHRFRRTLGTRAAEEGHGPFVIAALLDHSDIQNVGVYTASSPAIIERLDQSVAFELAPLAQAFAGVIKDGHQDGGDPGQPIIDLRVDRSGQTMGECGKHDFCGFSAPIACYTCRSFEAWVDGPHEAVLNYLIERREKLLESTDKRIGSINDRTILAVAAVVQRCRELKTQPPRSIDG